MAARYLDVATADELRDLAATLHTRQSGRCYLCGEPVDGHASSDGDTRASTIQPVEPLTAGGADEPANYALLHSSCSASRLHDDLEIARALAEFGPPRPTSAEAPPPAPPTLPAPAVPSSPTSTAQATPLSAAVSAPLSAPRSAPPALPSYAGEQQPRSFGSVLGLTIAGAALPGVGYLAAGRRSLGASVLAVVAVLVLGGLFLALTLNPRELALELASRPDLIAVLGIAVMVAAALWVAVIATGHRMLVPRSATPAQRATGAGLVAVLSLAVLLPAALAARYAFATKDLVTTVFAGGSADSDALSRTPIDRADPWKDTPRLSVLLLGADIAEADGGTVTSTVIAASIDTTTGETTVVSLPPGLRNAPIPADNPLAASYPAGYSCEPGPRPCVLSGLYREASERADLFGATAEPGVTTVRDVVTEITGVPIDYHLLVDLRGFAALVDAVGGIDLDVGPEPVAVDRPPDAGASPSPAVIPPGRQHLDGAQAVAFARADAGATADVTARADRQQAVLASLVAAAEPTELVTDYLVLSNAAQETLSTDVPVELLPALSELSELMRRQPLDVVPLPPAAVNPEAPDYGVIRQVASAALAGPTG